MHRYTRDGYVFPLNVFTAGEAASVQARCEDIVRTCNAPSSRIPRLHQYFGWAFDIACNPHLLDHVEQIIGPDILIWGTLVLSKAPQTEQMVSWHQDSAYAGFLNRAPALTAWIALTPATRESGCMRVLPASHHEQLPFTTEQEPNDMTARGQKVRASIDESKAVDVELNPGQASLHDVRLVHGSQANRASAPRTGFIVRYTSPAIEQPDYAVHLARGSAGAIQCMQPPAANDSEAQRAAYDRYLRSGGA